MNSLHDILRRLPAAALALATALPAAAQPASTTAALPAGSRVTTNTGLELQILRTGSGASPKASDVVRVNYRGRFTDGREFDSSYARGKPAEFPLDRVIPCWTEGLQRLAVGAKARLTCPPAIAYGSRGVGGVIPPDSTLVFEVELLAIVGRH